MPAYNFQRRFVDPILAKTKPHTIRRRRKSPTSVGDWLYLYTGQRTKQCDLIASAPCNKIDKVIIFPWKQEIWIADADKRGQYRTMDTKKVEALALRDGFEDVGQFFEFFKRYKEDALHDFEIIYWDVDRLMANYVEVRDGG